VDSFYNTKRPAGGYMTRFQTRRLQFMPVSSTVLEENLRKNRFRSCMLWESEPLRERLLQAFQIAMDINNRRWSEGTVCADRDQGDKGDQEEGGGKCLSSCHSESRAGPPSKSFSQSGRS
jgi:hypothetical protein